MVSQQPALSDRAVVILEMMSDESLSGVSAEVGHVDNYIHVPPLCVCAHTRTHTCMCACECECECRSVFNRDGTLF